MKTLLLMFALSMPLVVYAEPAEPPRPSPSPSGAMKGEPPPIAVGTKMKCPVSGEDFTVKAKTAQLVYKGKRYAFCCPDCIGDFKANPDKFAK